MALGIVAVSVLTTVVSSSYTEWGSAIPCAYGDAYRSTPRTAFGIRRQSLVAWRQKESTERACLRAPHQPEPDSLAWCLLPAYYSISERVALVRDLV